MMLEVLEARNKGEADLKPEGLGCKSHIWKKKKTNKQQNTWNFKLLKPQKHEGHVWSFSKPKLPHSSIPNKDLPSLDQTQPLERKGRACTRNDCLFQQVSSESCSFSSGKAEIKGSIAKRQVGLDFRGN